MNNDYPTPQDRAALDFLTQGLPPNESELVRTAYFVLGCGNADSAPVATAILLTACVRKMVEVPVELYQFVKEFRGVTTHAQTRQEELNNEMYHSINQLVAGFRDETARATNLLNQSITKTQAHTKYVTEAENALKEQVRLTMLEMDSANKYTRIIHSDLEELQRGLKLQSDFSRKMADAAEVIKTTQAENKKLVSHLSRQATIQWLLVGEIAGAVLMGVCQYFPPWAATLLFLTGMGLLQWFARISWNYISENFIS